ncbi:MAG: hypothetical protein ACJ74U_11565 [Jatrophihabitantaceae bacterium]
MTEQKSPSLTDQAECSDLEYDLAHEAVIMPGNSSPGTVKPAPTYVATETADYDGDYGYDLAHDIPKPERAGDQPHR